MQTDYDAWVPISKRMPRKIDSVILPTGETARILEDVKLFQESAAWYNMRGIPYRRGYLLHGEPGNGKSSLVIALASELGYDICMLNLNAKDMTDERLLSVLANVPAKSVVLVEDIDCVFNARTRCENKDTLTISGLLNAIDGVMASEGRILFVTTNHLDKLDPALIRPGRIDVTVWLSNASREQMEQLFLRFFPMLTEMAATFSKRGEPNTWSMATLQGHLLKYRDDPAAAMTATIVSI
jgi:chaperone BCS1